MMFHVEECILYQNFEQGDILNDMLEALSICCQEPDNPQKSAPLFYRCMNGLVEMANTYGFTGESLEQLPDLSSGKPRKCFQYLLRNHRPRPRFFKPPCPS